MKVYPAHFPELFKLSECSTYSSRIVNNGLTSFNTTIGKAIVRV